MSNIDIKNNIIVGFSVAGITARQQDNDYSPAISGLTIADNILYGNGNSNNALWVGFTPGSYSNDGGIKSDPSFISSPTNLHLNVGSPAIGAGTAITPPYDLGDYDGTAWDAPPSIGAYEYVGGVSVPTVTTSAVTPGVTTASGGGNVTSAGGGTVSERGIAYGAGANPTIAGSHTSNGSGTGVFTSSLSGLSASTIYHVRAYATNEAGTSYGADVQFTTNDVPSVYHGLVKSANRFIIYGNRLVKVE